MDRDAIIVSLMVGDIPRPAHPPAPQPAAARAAEPHAPDAAPTEAEASAPRALVLMAILWLAGLTWWLAIPSPTAYSFDDREAIVGNPVVQGELPAAAALDRDYWHHVGDAGHYRPLATLALRVDAQRVDVESAEAPRAFRLTNLGLHLVVVLLIGLALIRLERAGGPAFPWFGLALFAVHPACADAVAWISGRTSLLSAVGAAIALAALALLPAIRRNDEHGDYVSEGLIAFGAALLGTLVALLAKEDGVVVAASAPLVAYALPASTRAIRRRRGLAALAGAAVAVLVVAWLRHQALGSPMPSAPSAPLASNPLFERLAFGFSAWWQGVTAALLPWIPAPPSLAPTDVSPHGHLGSGVDGFTFGEGIPGWGLAGTLGALALVYFAVRRHRGAGLSFALTCLAALPLVQLVPAGELFAPRFLYQPLLLGVVWTSAVALAITRPLGPRVSVAVRVAVLLAFAWFSIDRAAPVYDTRESYWRAHLPAHESEAKIWNALGECAREQGDRELAREHFLKSHRLDPRYSRPLASLGALEAKAGNYDAAESWFEDAIIQGPREHSPRANLATILLKQGRADEALEWYQDAARLSPGRATYHRGVARAALELGDHQAARQAAQRAAELAPADRRTRALLKRLESSE